MAFVGLPTLAAFHAPLYLAQFGAATYQEMYQGYISRCRVLQTPPEPPVVSADMTKAQYKMLYALYSDAFVAPSPSPPPPQNPGELNVVAPASPEVAASVQRSHVEVVSVIPGSPTVINARLRDRGGVVKTPPSHIASGSGSNTVPADRPPSPQPTYASVAGSPVPVPPSARVLIPASKMRRAHSRRYHQDVSCDAYDLGFPCFDEEEDLEGYDCFVPPTQPTPSHQPTRNQSFEAARHAGEQVERRLAPSAEEAEQLRSRWRSSYNLGPDFNGDVDYSNRQPDDRRVPGPYDQAFSPHSVHS